MRQISILYPCPLVRSFIRSSANNFVKRVEVCVLRDKISFLEYLESFLATQGLFK
jgi:hypothetical protein